MKLLGGLFWVAKALTLEYKKEITRINICKKAQEVADQKGNGRGKGTGLNPQDSGLSPQTDKICYGCGTALSSLKRPLKYHRREECKGKDKKCARREKTWTLTRFFPCPKNNEAPGTKAMSVRDPINYRVNIGVSSLFGGK